MSAKSVYIPQPASENGQLRITGDEHRHLTVARAEVGETVEILDGRGHIWTTEIVSAGRRETVVRILKTREVEKDRVEIVLALSLIKASAFELALEKAVEVGVTRIVPVVAARSNAMPGRKLDRWKRVVVEAAKQSKRYHLPVIEEPVKFEQVLQFKASTRILFAEHGGGPLESALAGSPALCLVGPEGGWTDLELEAARANEFHAVTLGSGILRAETAAIIGAAILRYELERHY